MALLVAAALVVHSDISRTEFASGDVISASAVNAQLDALYAEVNALDDCPLGFIAIEATGRFLGCVQTSDNGAKTWHNATNDCFVAHGARLPTATEWYIAVANYSLTNETNDWEWLSDKTLLGPTTQTHGLSGMGGEEQESNGTTASTLAYRSWLPR